MREQGSEAVKLAKREEMKVRFKMDKKEEGAWWSLVEELFLWEQHPVENWVVETLKRVRLGDSQFKPTKALGNYWQVMLTTASERYPDNYLAKEEGRLS